MKILQEVTFRDPNVALKCEECGMHEMAWQTITFVSDPILDVSKLHIEIGLCIEFDKIVSTYLLRAIRIMIISNIEYFDKFGS